MSDADAAAIGGRRKDWVSEHRAMYLRSGGTEGHIMDLVPVNGLPFSSHCLIRYKGRKTGREPAGAEREKVWNYMVDCFPFYATYQKSTSRILPLVMMKAIEAIPVFTEQDAEGERQY
jgi:hypothetical protein